MALEIGRCGKPSGLDQRHLAAELLTMFSMGVVSSIATRAHKLAIDMKRNEIRITEYLFFIINII